MAAMFGWATRSQQDRRARTARQMARTQDQTADTKSSFNAAMYGRVIVSAVVVGMFAATASAQVTNEITDVTPDTATQGATGLLVTLILDTDSPPAPPAGTSPDSVTIGSIAGTSIAHDSQYIVTAVFDLPAAEPLGAKDVTINFTTPQGTLVFSATAGFTVTTGSDTPPSITQDPQSQTAPPGGSVTFTVVASGSTPLSYQWQKDLSDIGGATGSAYTINPVAEADAGMYRCVVTNAFGSATSNEAELSVAELPSGAYPLVDTAQDICYDETGAMTCPTAGQAFHGQDAQYAGHAPSYALSGDGLCVHDLVTGLTWQRSPDTDGDGDIDADDKLTWPELQTYPDTLNTQNFGGYNDWRLPTIKELYSLIDFRGTDPSACNTEADCPGLIPYIDTSYFDFAYGDTAAGERVIDVQYASSTLYVSSVDGELLFGVNFADGRIKGYWWNRGFMKTFCVICVRGNSDYGVNNLVDNGDGTITDLATGLMWMQNDSGAGMLWEDALDHAENLTYAGYDDWKLPDAKELQSILDYTRSPDTTGSAAIDPLFNASTITNEEGVLDYPYYWSSTTHVAYPDQGYAAAYLSFGRGLGYMNNTWQDVHGAGCQRSDPKIGDPDDYPQGHGPQGDAIRIYNHVRCVRTLSVPQLLAAVSTMEHGSAGWFDIDVMAADAVESRSGGLATLVATFDQPVQGVDGLDIGDVTVSSGTVDSVSILGSDLTVELSGVTDAATLYVSFGGIENAAGDAVTDALSFGVLAGDVTGDGAVNIFDLLDVRNDLGQPVDASRFLSDVTADGVISIFDLLAVRNQLTKTVD